jgi:DNA-binding NarL/FixJ family response regulator
MAKEKRPEVIVTDIEMPSINGIEAARLLRKCHCSAKFLFLTMHSEFPIIAEAFRTGAAGIVLKSCDTSELVEAIQSVAKSGTYITPLLADETVSALLTDSSHGPPRTSPTSRQLEVLRLIAEGKTMREVADLLGISTRTAETHKYEIMRLLGVQSTAALVKYAIRMKLISP